MSCLGNAETERERELLMLMLMDAKGENDRARERYCRSAKHLNRRLFVGKRWTERKCALEDGTARA